MNTTDPCSCQAQEKVLRLETKFAEIEAKVNQLQSDNERMQISLVLFSDLEGNFAESKVLCEELTVNNAELKEILRQTKADLDRLSIKVDQQLTVNLELQATVTRLESELANFKPQFFLGQDNRPTVESGVSQEQQELNTNIIIRGIKLKEDTPETKLRKVYSGICNFLGIADTDDFEPVQVSLLPPTSGSDKNSIRPLKVQLKSISAKRHLLQLRRSKKAIYSSDIGIKQTPNSSILITEHLTLQNQHLLYQARLLRGQKGYKFIWSNNGQILARATEKSKVVRIFDLHYINWLRSELRIESNTNGHCGSAKPIEPHSGDTHE